MAVDEDYRDFVGELVAQLVVAVDVNFLPVETAAAMKFRERLFDDFAEVASFAGVDHDLAEFRHWSEFSKGGWGCTRGAGDGRESDEGELTNCARDPSRTSSASG